MIYLKSMLYNFLSLLCVERRFDLPLWSSLAVSIELHHHIDISMP